MNINISSSSRRFLQKYFPAFFSYDSLSDALDALDDFIIIEGLDENDNMTAFGHEAQSVFDEIYMCNK